MCHTTTIVLYKDYIRRASERASIKARGEKEIWSPTQPDREKETKSDGGGGGEVGGGETLKVAMGESETD